MFRPFKSFSKDKRGAFAMQMALMIVPMTLCTGIAVDGGRIFLAKAALNAAIDAAGLAAGSHVGADSTKINTVVNTYAAKNFSASGATLVTPIVATVTGETIAITGYADVPMYFMGLAGQNTVRVRADTEIKQASEGLLVALVLDNTGSMWSGNNIAGLRTATQGLVDKLFDGQTTHPYLRVAIVPYAAAVNPGSVSESLVAMPLARGPVDRTDVTAWHGCVIERAGAASLDDTPPATTLWTPFWYEAGLDNDYDISDASTIKPGGVTNTNGVTGPNTGCPTPVLPLTNDKTQVDAAVTAMKAWNRGGTLTDIGMAWGMRVLTPGEPFTQSAAIEPSDGLSLWNSPKWRKAIVVMTDGESQMFDLTNPAGDNEAHPSASDYTGYQRLDDPLASGIFASTNLGTVKSILNSRIQSVCQTARDQGVVVYSVVFTGGVSSAVAQDVFGFGDANGDGDIGCATDAGKYWYAVDQAALNNSFAQIGADLTKLRVNK